VIVSYTNSEIAFCFDSENGGSTATLRKAGNGIVQINRSASNV
jgi:hypothetical protein